MARRKGLVGPVKAAVSPLPAGGFRAKRGTLLRGPEKTNLQQVKAAVKRNERIRLQPVKHSQSSARD